MGIDYLTSSNQLENIAAETLLLNQKELVENILNKKEIKKTLLTSFILIIFMI